jgi:hypothetical protein
MSDIWTYRLSQRAPIDSPDLEHFIGLRMPYGENDIRLTNSNTLGEQRANSSIRLPTFWWRGDADFEPVAEQPRNGIVRGTSNRFDTDPDRERVF